MMQLQNNEARPLTLAEICQAIENGHVVAEIENGSYVVRRRDLVRLARQQDSSPKAARPRRLLLAS